MKRLPIRLAVAVVLVLAIMHAAPLLLLLSLVLLGGITIGLRSRGRR